MKKSGAQWIAGFVLVLCMGTRPDAAQAGHLLTDTEIILAGTAPAGQTVMRVYDVSDLIARSNPAPFSDVPLMDLDQPESGKRDPKQIAIARQKTLAALEAALHDALPANSWKENGGRGSIVQIPGQEQIIVGQSAHNQEILASLLAKWRVVTSRQVNIDSRFLVLDDAVLKKLGFFDRNRAAQKTGTPATYLDDKKVAELLRWIGKDARCHIVASPRVTVYVGQEAYVAVTTQNAYVADVIQTARSAAKTEYEPKPGIFTTGCALVIDPIVAPDGKYITVRFHAREKQLTDMKTQAWKDDPRFSIQKPVVDVHDAQSVVSIADSATLMLAINDTAGEKRGQSHWILIRPELIAGRSS